MFESRQLLFNKFTKLLRDDNAALIVLLVQCDDLTLRFHFISEILQIRHAAEVSKLKIRGERF
jgi:hypothetical protein